MEPRPYNKLSDAELAALCCWREARGESYDAKIAQCWSVKNRVLRPSWYNDFKGFPVELGDPRNLSIWQRTILKPWQYSSFNKNDPNENKWPSDTDGSFVQAQEAVEAVMLNSVSDPTNGGTSYYDVSIGFPAGWGNQAEWENTLNVGRFKFWKMRPPQPADLSTDGGELA